MVVCSAVMILFTTLAKAPVSPKLWPKQCHAPLIYAIVVDGRCSMPCTGPGILAAWFVTVGYPEQRPALAL